MKKRLWLGISTLVLSLFVGFFGLFTKAYDLTPTDLYILDSVEEKIFDAVDNGDIQADTVFNVIVNLIENKKLSERTETVFLMLLEDFIFEYEADLGLDEYNDEDYAMTESECFEDEYYDKDEQRCFPEDEEYYDDIDDEDFWDEYYDEDFNDDFGDAQEGDAQKEDYTIYSISGNALIHTDGDFNKEDGEKYSKIWSVFTQIIPVTYRTDLINFVAYNNAEGDVFGAVYQNEENHDKWNLEINAGLFFNKNGDINKEGFHTLIHEYGHVLTLNKTQVEYISSDLDLENDAVFDRLSNKCTTHFIMEGCLKEKSYFENFIDAFWSKSMLEIVRNENGDVYEGHENDFVSDYASSNPGEDIAETFAAFMLKSKPTGKTKADKKILFFYDYPELVQLRSMVRSRLEGLRISS